MNSALTYLADKAHIGIITGIVAWLMSTFNFLFDDALLQIVGGIGIYMGVFVASLTALLKAFDLIDRVRKWFKDLKKK